MTLTPCIYAGGGRQCCVCTCARAVARALSSLSLPPLPRRGWSWGVRLPVSEGKDGLPPEMGSNHQKWGAEGGPFLMVLWSLVYPPLFRLHPPHLGLQAGPGETHSRGWEPPQPCSLISPFPTLRVQRRCRESRSGCVLLGRGGKEIPPSPQPQAGAFGSCRRLGKQREVPLEMGSHISTQSLM